MVTTPISPVPAPPVSDGAIAPNAPPETTNETVTTAASSDTSPADAKKPADGQPTEDEQRQIYLLRITIGNLEFSNQKGDFLGLTQIKLRTNQIAEVLTTLNDEGPVKVEQKAEESPTQEAIAPEKPSNDAGQNQIIKPDSAAPPDEPAPPEQEAIADTQTDPAAQEKPEQTLSKADDLWGQIKANEGNPVVVEVGFPPYLNRMEGKLNQIGRRMPNGIILEICDVTANLANSTGPNVTASAEKLPGSPDPAAATAADTTTVPGTSPGAIAPLATDTAATPSTSAGQNATAPTDASIPVPATPETLDPALKLQAEAAAAAVPTGTPTTSPLEKRAAQQGITVEKSTQNKSGDFGSLAIALPAIAQAATEAAKVGEVIVADGSTIKQIGPGQGPSSGLTLSWKEHRAAFIRPPTVTRKTPLQLQGPAGALTVTGWSPNDKQVMGATVVTPSAPSVHPTGVISVPQWQDIKLSDPITPGSPYTWADATRNGERVPENQGVVEGIIKIAQVITQFTAEVGKGKWEITSWYRDPATNQAVSSSGANGPHTTGTAIDFWFEPSALIAFHEKLDASWEGGVAIHPGVYDGSGGFVHIDMIGHPQGVPGSARRRWSY